MEAIDRIYTAYPFFGSRKMRFALQDYDKIFIGRDHLRRLMKLVGLQAIYPKKKNVSESHRERKKFPNNKRRHQSFDYKTPREVYLK